MESRAPKKKQPKKYYIRKNPLPRILKRDFRRDFPTMFQNVINSAEGSMIESFFITFATPDFHMIVHNPILSYFGVDVIQQQFGLQNFVTTCANHISTFADLVILTEKASIIQQEGTTGSKIITRLHAKATRISIPNPNSMSKIDKLFCTCNFFDRQKLAIVKSVSMLRAQFADKFLTRSDSLPFAQVHMMCGSIRESLQSLPKWSSSLLESISDVFDYTKVSESDRGSSSGSPTTSSSSDNNIRSHHQSSSMSSNGQFLPTKIQKGETIDNNPTVCCIDVEFLIQQMQLFHKSFSQVEELADEKDEHEKEEDTGTNNDNKKLEQEIQKNENNTIDSPVHKRRKKLPPSPTKSNLETETENIAIESSTSTGNIPSPHFINFQREPVFAVCCVCGRNKFPNTTTLQALAKPFMLRASLHPLLTFYFDEQNQLYRAEAMIPVEKYSYSLDLPAL